MTVRIVRELAPGVAEGRPLFLAIGNFDGVHLGHQQLVRTLVGEASAACACAAVMTFEPHVRRVLRPDDPLPLLTRLEDRALLLEDLGVELLLVVPFSREFARRPAEEFASDVLAGVLGVRRVFVGESFTFGRGGCGTPEDLARYGRALGFDVRVVPPVRRGEAVVSSTAIRRLLAEGDVERAAEMLGRPHLIDGRVVPGAGRGRRLGFPTANVDPGEDPLLLPALGVYAVEVCAPGLGRAGGVANLGLRPTFGDASQPTLEVHLPDRAVDLRDRTVRVAFVARLRGERRFADADALARQIAADVEAAREALSRPRPGRLDDGTWARYLCRSLAAGGT